MKRASLKFMLQTMLLLVTLAWGIVVYANQFGRTGATRKTSTLGCGESGGCHDSSPSTGVTVAIVGPDTISVGQLSFYTVTITGGPAVAGGTDIAASNGTLAPADTLLKFFDGELTHQNPTLFPASKVLSFRFFYTAPAIPGTQTLFANGNSVNGNSAPTFDQWNFAPDKKIIVRASATFADNSRDESPSSFELFQNYPNPFNPSTMIRYTLPSPARTTLSVFDLNGREVATLVNQQQSPGSHEVQFVAPSHLASATYVYTIVAGSFVGQKKMVLVK